MESLLLSFSILKSTLFNLMSTNQARAPAEQSQSTRTGLRQEQETVEPLMVSCYFSWKQHFHFGNAGKQWAVVKFWVKSIGLLINCKTSNQLSEQNILTFREIHLDTSLALNIFHILWPLWSHVWEMYDHLFPNGNIIHSVWLCE